LAGIASEVFLAIFIYETIGLPLVLNSETLRCSGRQKDIRTPIFANEVGIEPQELAGERIDDNI
jgi:hypothetical protein